MPVSVELHYDLWSEEAEYIAVPQLRQFWDRKQVRNFDGHAINVLCDEDLLGFATLHLLLHVMHGDLPLQRAWEIARFLNAHVSGDAFWTSWRTLHPPALRELETSMFYLVTNWFGCRCREELAADVQKLPVKLRSWLQEYPLAPLAREWTPNKSEIWLHVALISKSKDKVRVLFRRLLPVSMPSVAVRMVSQAPPRARLQARVRQLRFLVTRLTRHCVTFFPTLFDALRWLLLRS